MTLKRIGYISFLFLCLVLYLNLEKMEPVLRKVRVSERLPSTNNYYYVILLKGENRAVREYSPSYDNWWKENIAYWYEEVSLDFLLALEKQKYLTELAEQLKGANARLECIPSYISHIKCLEEEAKERYEKALQAYQNWDVENDTEFTIFTALKIAAGIEEK